MSKFIRHFPIELLDAHRGSRGLTALFDRWVLPGQSAGPHGLRLAIRNGYLNFYVKGQSIGKLYMISDSPRLELHRKYFEVAKNGSPKDRNIGQKYTKIDAEALAKTRPDTVDDWIQTAETYAGDEKRFVDDLIDVTAGTIDMEMALPADADANERTAPRMDLVVAQGKEIAFWEAKCAVNGDLRARKPYREEADGTYCEGPHILWQLRRYERWMGYPDRVNQVRDAYVATAQQFLKIAHMFNKKGAAIDKWEELANAGSNTSVVLPPGIVVGDYRPERADAVVSDECEMYAARARSFADHKARLAAHGAQVVQVSNKPDCAFLPQLKPGAITDREHRS